MSFRYKLPLSALIVFVVMTFLFSSILYVYSGEVQHLMLQESQDALKVQASYVDSLVSELNQLARIIQSDDVIQTFLGNDLSQGRNRVQAIWKIRNRLTNYLLLKESLLRIDIVKDGIDFCVFNGEEKDRTWLETAEAFGVQKGYIGQFRLNTSTQINVDVYTFAYPFNTYKAKGNNQAILYFHVDPDAFAEKISCGVTYKWMAMLDEADQVLFHTAQEEQRFDPSKLAQKEVLKAHCQQIAWSLTAVADADGYRQAFRSKSVSIVVVFAVSVLSLLAVTLGVGNSVASPMKRIIAATQQIKKGNLNVRLSREKDPELDHLCVAINEMCDSLQRQMKRIVEEEEEKKGIQMDLLWAQINPHFIYNTLNSISYLCALGRTEEALTVISAFSKILQNNLKQDKLFCTLAEEKTMLEDYLRIQSIRYPNRFEVAYDIEETAQECVIPRMIIQPLVENSLFHGILPNETIGHIRVCARLVDENIVLSASDDGIGMSPVELEQVLMGQESRSASRMHNIGIANIRQRLQLLYGDEQQVSIQTAPMQGMTIEMTIPKKEE